MIRQIREAMVSAMGVKMHAKRPSLPMVRLGDGDQARGNEGQILAFKTVTCVLSCVLNECTCCVVV